jgi:hypothetical protein
MSEIFSVEETDIQSKIEEGYSLTEIQNALIQKKHTNENLDTILFNIKPDIVNNSAIVESEIKSDLNGNN